MDKQAHPVDTTVEQPERIFARQLALELSEEEIEQVSGGMLSIRGGTCCASTCCGRDGDVDC